MGRREAVTVTATVTVAVTVTATVAVSVSATAAVTVAVTVTATVTASVTVTVAVPVAVPVAVAVSGRARASSSCSIISFTLLIVVPFALASPPELDLAPWLDLPLLCSSAPFLAAACRAAPRASSSASPCPRLSGTGSAPVPMGRAHPTRHRPRLPSGGARCLFHRCSATIAALRIAPRREE